MTPPDPDHLRQLGDRLEELGDGWEAAARMVRAAAEMAETGVGVPIRCNDRLGRPIHVGDTLRYVDPPLSDQGEFTVAIGSGRIVYPGYLTDLARRSEIVRHHWEPRQ